MLSAEISATNFLHQAHRMLRLTNVLIGSTFEQRYKQTFGLSPFLTSVLWYRLVTAAEDTESSYSLPLSTQPKHLLWALLFLRIYATEAINANITGSSKKTFRKWSWIVVNAIADLYSTVVS